MRKIIYVIIAVILSFILPIPTYDELNNLAIIEGAAIEYGDGYYTIYLKEIIPKRDSQGIEYDYKYYNGTGRSLEKAYENISSKTKKKLYLSKIKFLILNYNDNDVCEYLNIKPKKIYYKRLNVYEYLKKINY